MMMFKKLTGGVFIKVIKLNKLSDNYDIHCLLALVFEKDRSAKPYVNWGYL